MLFDGSRFIFQKPPPVLIIPPRDAKYNQNFQYNVTAHILSGGLMLGAVFMATDYTTSPMTKKGKIIFAIGCGLLTYIIRVFSSYPEGVSFAILIMNAFVPLIDQYCPQYIYGTRRK